MAPPPRIANAVFAYAARLRTELGDRVHDVRLFGSWARGTAGPDSDIDVLVRVDRRDETSRTVPYALYDEILFRDGVNLTPLVMDDAEWTLLTSRERRIVRDIAREGIPF